ncbi:hypothetical protein MTP04_14190 [Lysinibacillus sp. PLM2]|nr:hypothetical protein MTP04_14190 [Lysinibacillus sp. PLM2]
MGAESAGMKVEIAAKWNFRIRKCPNENDNRRKRELWELKVPE